MCRYNLPITVVVINNNGIGSGVSQLQPDRPVPPGVYLPGSRYEMVMQAFPGGRGYFVDRPEQLHDALTEANEGDGPALVHIAIDPRATRKPQQFAWHTGSGQQV